MSETTINGIDVSECKYLNKVVNEEPYCNIDEEHLYTCSSDENCYFKQLKRLQEENEKLRKKVNEFENKFQLRMASDKESDEYWDEIFNEENYPFNKENAYKELSDYYFVLNQIPIIYMEITGGRLSKTTYFASSVIEAYHDAIQEYWDKIDDFETTICKYKQALEEIRNLAELELMLDKNSKAFYPTNIQRILDEINEVLNE